MNQRRKSVSPSFRIIAKLLKVLLDNGPVTKTALSQKSGVNYSRLRKYVDWLEQKGIVELKVHQHKVVIHITKDGRDFTQILLRGNNR